MQNTDPAIVEFANDAFYLAFNSRDIEQMNQLWAEDYPTVCIHPGWSPLFGRDEILDSWTNIFAGQGSENQIICHEPRVLPQGDIFSVICYEQLPSGWLIATNNFIIESGRAKIVHHHPYHESGPGIVFSIRQTGHGVVAFPQRLVIRLSLRLIAGQALTCESFRGHSRRE